LEFIDASFNVIFKTIFGVLPQSAKATFFFLEAETSALWHCFGLGFLFWLQKPQGGV